MPRQSGWNAGVWGEEDPRIGVCVPNLISREYTKFTTRSTHDVVNGKKCTVVGVGCLLWTVPVVWCLEIYVVSTSHQPCRDALKLFPTLVGSSFSFRSSTRKASVQRIVNKNKVMVPARNHERSWEPYLSRGASAANNAAGLVEIEDSDKWKFFS